MDELVIVFVVAAASEDILALEFRNAITIFDKLQ